jgi:hypothetical protein
MGRLFNLIRYLSISGIMLIMLTAGKNVLCQPIEEPEINWAEWNVSVAYITEIDIWNTSIIEDIYYLYNLGSNDGIAYSVAKPLGRFVTAGIGMSDLRLEGYRLPATDPLGYWIWPEEYSTRIRNFSIALRFHPFSKWAVHPYLELKPGILGVKARVNYPSGHFSEYNTGKPFLEKNSKPSLKELHAGFGGGITWEAASLLSFDIGIEINTLPSDYLKVLSHPGKGFDIDYAGKRITYGRLVVAITSHSDFSKLFNRRNNPYFNGRYEPHKYLPFYKKRKGNY